MTGILVPPKDQWIDLNGNPLVAGTIATYIPNSFVEKDTWEDRDKVTINTNPIVLDLSGRHAIYGDGDYRFIVKDSLGNLIYDAETSEYLASDFISTVMRPVTQAETLQQARDLMGITAAIQTAIDNVDLLPGPTGPQGAQGIQGLTGPTGAGASSGGYEPILNGNNPGYISFPNVNTVANWYEMFGFSSTSSGLVTVNFATAFPNACFGVQLTPFTSAADVCIALRLVTNNGFTVASSSIGFPGGGFGGNVQFYWRAIGY